MPRTLAEAVALRAAIIDGGYSPQVASGIVGWLVEKRHEQIDRSELTTRTRYRKVLEDVFGGKPPIMYRPFRRAA